MNDMYKTILVLRDSWIKLEKGIHEDASTFEEIQHYVTEMGELLNALHFDYVNSLTFSEPTKEIPDSPKLTEKEEIKYALDALLDWAESGLVEWHGSSEESMKWYNTVLGALDLDETVEGKHNRVYPTGAQRDSDEGKPKLTYLPWDVLDRVAFHYEKGAQKYGDDNWRLGMSSLEILDSLMRHTRKYFMGMDDEDHLSAIVFNALCLIYNEENFKDTPEVHDLPKWWVEKGFRKE